MGCIKVFYADMHDDEALIEQPLSSLLDGNETAFYPLPMPSGDVTIWLNQGAGDVDPTSGIHAVHEVTRNTPPR